MQRLLLILACWMTFSAAAQQIQTSMPIDFNVRNEGVNILALYKGTIYTHLFDRSTHRIAAFRENLGLKWDKYLPVDTRHFRVEEVFFEQGHFIGLYTEKVKGNRLIKGQVYHPNLDSIGEKVPIDSIVGKFARATPELEVQFSQDRKLMAIYYLEEIFDQEDILHYTICTPQLEVKDRGNVSIPTKDARSSFHDLLISNSGEVFVVTADFKDSGKDHATQYLVQRSGMQFIADSTYAVSPGANRFLNNTQFKIDNANQTLVITGFYAEDYRQPVHAEGLYFLVLDLAKNEVKTASFQAFPTEFIAKIKGVRNPKRANKLYTFLIDDVILRQDGGALVVAESYYRTYRANAPMYDIYGMPMRSETTISYHFDEIIVVSLHPDGTMHWKNILIKSQNSTGDFGRHGSYALLNTGKYLLFLFNDDLNTRTNVVQYAIDGSGTLSRDIILNSRKYDVYVLPQFGQQISARSIVMPSIRKNELRLLKVDY